MIYIEVKELTFRNKMTQRNLSQMEKELLKNPVVPVTKKRADYGYKINYGLSSQISDTLNKIKGRIDEEIGETGDLEINEYIDFRIQQKLGFINNMDIFKETVEVSGLDVFLLIDCSGSMRRLEQKLADVTATIMHSMEKCSFINFKTIAFSAYSHKYQSVNDYIKDYTEAGRIHADEDHYHDIQNLAIDEARKQLSDSENKKLIILITDGYPEAEHKGLYVDGEILQSLMERSVTEARNQEIEVFCIFYQHIRRSEITELMQKIFGNKLYTTQDFNDISEKLIQKLKLSVESLNNGASG